MSDKPLTFLEIAEAAKTGITFNPSGYPVLTRTAPEDVGLFALKHLAVHLSKNVGAISGVVEQMDHGQPIDDSLVINTVRKLVINSLKFAELAGVAPEVIERNIRFWHAKK